MNCLRGDDAALYERYAQRLQRAVARVLGADRRHAEDGCAFARGSRRAGKLRDGGETDGAVA